MKKPHYQQMPLEEALKRIYHSEPNPNGALDQWYIGLMEIEGEVEKCQWRYSLKENHYELRVWYDELKSFLPDDLTKKIITVLELAVQKGTPVVVRGNLSVECSWCKRLTPGKPYLFQEYNRFNGRFRVKTGSLLIHDIKRARAQQAGELSLYEGGLEGALSISEEEGALSVVDEHE